MPRTEIVCGDWHKIRIPTKNVVLVTDPPYGINYKSGPNSKNSISTVGKRFTVSIEGDNKPFDPAKLLSRFEQVAFTGAQYFYTRLPPYGMFHCWNKRGDYKPLDQADADMIWVRSKKKSANRPRVFNLVWRGLCRHSENRQKIEHPTQKPVELMKWMIGLLSVDEETTVVDPFMGSGSTGIAAKELGLSFFGIEKVEEYFVVAKRRLQCPELIIG